MISCLNEIGLNGNKFEKIRIGTFSEDKVVNFFSFIKKILEIWEMILIL